MDFKTWFESAQDVFTVPVAKLYAWTNKADDVIADIHAGRLSQTQGPILVSKLDKPRGAFFILDGHHRAVEAGMKGQNVIQANINVHLPNIDRAGEGYANMRDNKIPLTEVIRRITSERS